MALTRSRKGRRLNMPPGVATATVSKKGWVVIPKEMRERHGIRSGDQVIIVEIGSRLILTRARENPIEAGFGLLKGGPSMTEELLEERARELEREERDLLPPPGAAFRE